jgi:hypothetical protein
MVVNVRRSYIHEAILFFHSIQMVLPLETLSKFAVAFGEQT